MDYGGRGIVQPAKGPLGRAVRGARHDLHLSQQRLADLAGVSQTAVSKLELGRPSWSLFCKLVDAVGGRPVVTIEGLLTDREIMDLIVRGEPLPPGVGAENDDWW